MSFEGVVPRLAATVVLLRPGRDGLECLLTLRPASMAFAADMHVFPGGRVDPADGDPRLVARSAITPEAAAAALGGDLDPDQAIAVHIAAIREVFEETGILLADASGPERGMARSISLGRSALVGGDTDLATLADELDLTLRTDRLAPLSRWVTPPILARRFDARFFVAAMPDGARVSFEGDEVAGHAWLTPKAGLAEMAAGSLGMWIPTSATLQQLAWVRSLDEIRERLAPSRLVEPLVEVLTPEVTRIVMPAGGGVAGQPIMSYLVGRERLVLVDPGDPTGAGTDLALAVVHDRGATIDGIALTRAAPDHAGGADGLAERLGIPIVVGPDGGRYLPFDVRTLADGEGVPFGDVPLTAIHTPGPSPEHLAFAIERGPVISGDLGGVNGARTVEPVADLEALAASRERVSERHAGAGWLPAHPGPGLE